MWGVITTLAMSAFSLSMYLAGNMNRANQYIGFVIMFIGIVIGMIQCRNKVNGGFGSFGEQFKIGLLITLMVTGLNTIYLIVFLQLTPGFIDKIKQQAEANMINKGLTTEQMQMGMKMMEKFTTPAMMVVFGLIGTIFFGVILTLIAAAITNKPKPFMEEDNNAMPS